MRSFNYLPKDFFSILEDIKTGCFPRLYSHYINNDNLNSNVNLIKNVSISNSTNKVVNQSNNNFNSHRPSNLNLDFNLNNNNNSDTCLQSLVNNGNCNIMEKNSVINKNSNNDGCTILQQIDNKHFTPEIRRIKEENCTLLKCLKNTDKQQLVLKLKFDDDLCRTLECTLSNNDIYKSDLNHNNVLNNSFVFSLANELIDFGLISDKDKEILTNILIKTLIPSH